MSDQQPNDLHRDLDEAIEGARKTLAKVRQSAQAQATQAQVRRDLVAAIQAKALLHVAGVEPTQVAAPQGTAQRSAPVEHQPEPTILVHYSPPSADGRTLCGSPVGPTHASLRMVTCTPCKVATDEVLEQLSARRPVTRS